MNCHDIQLLISGFIENRLTDEQLACFLDHIDSCQDCYDELEVYYIITTGLLQLDEDHTGTLDLKKGLRDYIAQQRRMLQSRKRTELRRRRVRWASLGALILALVFTAHVFITTEEGIHTTEDFQTAVVHTLYNLWFGETRTSDSTDVEVSGTEDPMVLRHRFELEHPLPPSYFPQITWTVPGNTHILEKDR